MKQPKQVLIPIGLVGRLMAMAALHYDDPALSERDRATLVEYLNWAEAKVDAINQREEFQATKRQS